MSSRLEKVVECDVCGKGATEYAITVNGDSSEIDLCKEHDKWVTGLISQIVSSGRILRGNTGRAARGEASRRGRTPGPLDAAEKIESQNREPVEWRTCGYKHEPPFVSKNRRALNAHIAHEHKAKMTEHDRKFNRKFPCPACGEVFEDYRLWGVHADNEGHRP